MESRMWRAFWLFFKKDSLSKGLWTIGDWVRPILFIVYGSLDEVYMRGMFKPWNINLGLKNIFAVAFVIVAL
jgi:hypothetical protein